MAVGTWGGSCEVGVKHLMQPCFGDNIFWGCPPVEWPEVGRHSFRESLYRKQNWSDKTAYCHIIRSSLFLSWYRFLGSNDLQTKIRVLKSYFYVTVSIFILFIKCFLETQLDTYLYIIFDLNILDLNICVSWINASRFQT